MAGDAVTAVARCGPDPLPATVAPGAHVWGWMSPPELEWLHTTAATMRSVAEVGCLHGRSSYALASGCPGEVWCVDPWDDEDDHCYPSFLAACGHFPNLRPVRGYSPTAAVDVPDVDMVFLDGDHAHASVAFDLAAWSPKARRLICGHDYNHPGYPGVAAAVDAVYGGRVRPAVGDGWDDPNMSIWVVEL